jgi:hypothetical protein
MFWQPFWQYVGAEGGTFYWQHAAPLVYPFAQWCYQTYYGLSCVRF